MSNTVSWNLQLNVREGQLETLRSLMEEMSEATHSDELGTLAYEWFLSEDDTVCHLYERYADAEAVMIHLGHFGSKFMSRFMDCLEPTGFHVYGNPDDEARSVLDGLGAVYFRSFGGFSR